MNSVLLSQSEQDELLQVFGRFPDVEEAIVFGSRAKGNAKVSSDVDIALKGNTLTREIIGQIHGLLEEEISLPYFFDVLNYHEISNKDLLDHIDRVGVVIYRKK
ncbi:MAG: nucleotidyltransferase domain-containing protein [bacterium]|nr:nucleotidyltransferase domain-containing protein [bacterium]